MPPPLPILLTPDDLTGLMADDRVVAATRDHAAPPAGQASTLDAVFQTASDEVWAAIGQRYSLPLASGQLATCQLLLKTLALPLALEALFARRGFTDTANPWAERAAEKRQKLDAIAAGKQPLFPAITATSPASPDLEPQPEDRVTISSTPATFTRRAG